MSSSFFTVQPEELNRAPTDTPADEHPLEGAPIQLGRLNQFNARGRTLKSTLHPLRSQGQAWIAEKHLNARMQSTFIGTSTSILPEELLFYPFDVPRQALSEARIKFMEECSVVFEELQVAHAQYAIPGYLNRFSKLYESHFEALCTALDAEQLNSQLSNAVEIEDEAANVSSAMNLIHLTQAIYFQPNPSAIMAEDLMHWVNRLDSRPDPAEANDIARKQPACHHPSFWTFLHKAASRALFKVAISCIKTSGLVEYDGVDSSLLEAIIQSLNNAPLGKQSQLSRKANDLWALKNAWKQWRSGLEKIQIASIRNENARTGLGILLKILRGDKNAVAEVSESWQEYVASMAFFSIPFDLNSYKDVRQLYDDAMDYGFNIDNTLASEIASSALFTSDLPRALVYQFKTDMALAVHVSDLLSKSGVLGEFDDVGTLALRDRFILDYGDLAISTPQLAYTAFIYWKSVEPQGIWRIEEAIVRVPLEEQAQVDQLVDLCLDLHLESQRTDICQAWARRLEGNGQVGLALTYFEKGQGFSDIERICWNHFEHLLMTGGNISGMDPKLMELLENPPQSPMTGTLIAPLALLLAFFNLRDKGDTGAAVQHLSKLFRLSSMPREYIALLMAEMLPILDAKQRAVIGQKDLFEILAAVEDYVADEGTSQKGFDLLSKAVSLKGIDESISATQNWREMIPSSSPAREVVSLFRVKVTDIIAQLYTTN